MRHTSGQLITWQKRLLSMLLSVLLATTPVRAFAVGEFALEPEVVADAEPCAASAGLEAPQDAYTTSLEVQPSEDVPESVSDQTAVLPTETDAAAADTSGDPAQDGASAQTPDGTDEISDAQSTSAATEVSDTPDTPEAQENIPASETPNDAAPQTPAEEQPAQGSEAAEASVAPEAEPDAASADADADVPVVESAQEQVSVQPSMGDEPAKSPAAAPAIEDAVPVGNPTLTPTGDASTSQTATTLPLLAIVMGFNDLPYSLEFDWGSTLFGAQDSLRTYFSEASEGAFTVVPVQESYANEAAHDVANDGVVHVTLDDWQHGKWTSLTNWSSLTERQKAASDEKNYNEYMLEVFKQAINKTNPYVDFASYDSDGSGSLSTAELAICFVVAGFEGAFSPSVPANQILWAHSWRLGAAPKYENPTTSAEPRYTNPRYTVPKVDGVTVNYYTAVAEQLKHSKKTEQEPFGVIAHELGHQMDLPDLYPTARAYGNWDFQEVGNMSLMADGEWSEIGNEYRSVGLDAWSRTELGWIEPVEVTQEGIYDVCSIGAENGSQTLLVRVSDTEYYLIENRQAEGVDASLDNYYSPGSGIALWHVDADMLDAYLAKNTPNDCNHRPAVMPLFTQDGDNPMWDSLTEDTLLDDDGKLYLPLYDGAQQPSDVGTSDVWVRFLTKSGRVMQVQIGFDEDDEEPEDPDDPDDPDDPEGLDDPDNPDDPDDPEDLDDPDDPDDPDDLDDPEDSDDPIDLEDPDEPSDDETISKEIDNPTADKENWYEPVIAPPVDEKSAAWNEVPASPEDRNAVKYVTTPAPARSSLLLPQTGDATRPPVALAALGAVLVVVGCVMRRRIV